MLKYITSGDSGLIIKAGEDISEDTSIMVRKLLLRIEQEKIRGIVDYIPSFNELLICFDPLLTDPPELKSLIKSLENDISNVELPESGMVNVPVLYGGKHGPDIGEVAAHCKIPVDDVIRIHSASEYLVYMLGFTPGFCYLGGMDRRIYAPRKNEPRVHVPQGSVGIAGNQTGIYPVDSPGGWQIIGITPLRLFDPAGSPEFLISPGDRVRFFPISEDEFEKIKADTRNI